MLVVGRNNKRDDALNVERLPVTGQQRGNSNFLGCAARNRDRNSSCPHAPGYRPAVSGKRLPDGTFATRLPPVILSRWPGSLLQLWALP